MLSKIQKNVAICIVLMIFVAGCNNTDNPTSKSNNHSSILFFPDTSQIDESTIIATLTVYKAKEYSNEINNEISYSGCDAAFYNSSHSIWVGNVTLNNNDVSSYSTFDSTNGTTLFAYGDQPYQSFFDGRLYSWSVSGSNEFQAFSISVNAPNYEMSISNLTPNQTISKTSDLVINWNNNNNPSVGVKVMIIQENIGYTLETSDNGTCTINSTNLTQFSDGPAYLVIFSGNYAIYPLGNMNALALIYSSHEIPVNFSSN
jgi:hypothetical protein